VTIQKLATTLLLLAATLHLSGFGVLPYGWKPAGDAILLLLLCCALIRRTVRPSFADRTPRLTIAAVISVSVYVVWLTVSSIQRIDDGFLVIQWARRWLILALYALTLLCCRDLFDRRVLKVGLLAMTLAATGVMVATDLYGINWPNVVESVEFQGGILIKKISVPGAFLIVLMTLYAWASVLARPSAFSLAQLFVWSSVFVLTIRFRGWWIGLGLAVVVMPIIEPIVRLAPKTLFRNLAFAVFLLASLGIGAILSSQAQREIGVRIEWISSVFDELQNGTGNVAYRMDKDVARIDVTGTRSASLSWFGYGFIPTGSAANIQLGITSETNDSGWVEVLLTGGYLAAILLAILVLAIVVHIWKSDSDRSIKTAAASGWLVAVATMFSSNLLLWDFGFVPLMLWYSLAVTNFHPSAPARNLDKKWPLKVMSPKPFLMASAENGAWEGRARIDA
jgi:hypothetical protein